jgi:hypothetical protein
VELKGGSRKRSTGLALRVQKPRKGHISCISTNDFIRYCVAEIHAPGEEKFAEMLKKLDYERILGYTPTGFESGG